MRRLARKLQEIRSWVNSSNGGRDAAVAALLSICRTRPPNGSGMFARSFRLLIPNITIRPRSLGGRSLSINPADVSELVIYDEIFVQKVYDLSFLPFEPDVVVDCGGFGGYFTLLARARFPQAKFVVFEPNPKNYESMCANIERNGGGVETLNEAVSNCSGEMSFTGGGLGGKLSGDAEGLRVRVADIGEVLARLAPQRLLLKLDVEGEEEKILPSLISTVPPACAIFFEWHHSSRGLGDVKSALNEVGFTVLLRAARDFGENVLVDAFALRCPTPGGTVAAIDCRQ
jgi:FkbM family methyltransferase